MIKAPINLALSCAAGKKKTPGKSFSGSVQIPPGVGDGDCLRGKLLPIFQDRSGHQLVVLLFAQLAVIEQLIEFDGLRL